jgi:hypothetical protein
VDTPRFDRLTRLLADISSRRTLNHVLAAVAGSALPKVQFQGSADANNKKRKKPKKNEFGCLNIGKACNGKDNKCCSGICKGKGPKKGKKDKSKCIAHDVGSCVADQDSCLGAEIPCGAGATCFRTTGRASFCAGEEAGECVVCNKDTDCESDFGVGAACVVCPNCFETGTACVSPAV